MAKKTNTGKIGKRKSKKTSTGGYSTLTSNKYLCDGMPFTYSEVCKNLRTKINMLVPDELLDSKMVEEAESGEAPRHRCKVIGVTSALPGEGKTTTSINFAYTIAETMERVCLIEADMRLPNLAKRFAIKENPGLLNLLIGQNSFLEAIQRYRTKKGISIYTIVAGGVPPDPAELLDSDNMKKAIDFLRGKFDYIIIDLPPVTAVTDALVVSKYIDGLLLVVRQDYCDKQSLQYTMDQLNMTEDKLLGVVLNCAAGHSGGTAYYRKSNK